MPVNCFRARASPSAEEPDLLGAPAHQPDLPVDGTDGGMAVGLE